MIHQQLIVVPARCRGYHLITSMILKKLGELPDAGLLNLFIQHTSAALTINENADPSVRTDFESAVNRIVPEGASYYTHTLEGNDDMPAHVKSSLFGPVRGRVFICVSSVIMGETAVFWRHCIIEEEEANRICRVGQVFFLRNPVSGEPVLPTLT